MNHLVHKGVISCWSCKGPALSRALFCPVCEVIMPPCGLNHFDRLGVEKRFTLNMEDLERHYFAMQRRLHPDRFSTKSSKEKAISQQQAVSLNEAYETLKDPLKRAIYLLKEEGREIKTCPQLLAETMEAHEELAETPPSQMGNFRNKIRQKLRECEDDLTRLFDNEQNFEQASFVAARLQFFHRLLGKIQGD